MIERALRIAVLDDEAPFRRALVRLLRVHGYGAESFGTAESFLAAQARQAFACVVMDLQMPGVGGESVLIALAARPSPPAVIIVTADEQPGDGARLRRLGASAYLTKPVDESDLMEAIARHGVPSSGPGEDRPH